MKDTYVYPAVITVDADGISVEFPDLPGCLSCADTTEEAARNANEALRLHLWSMEKDGDVIPAPTDLTKIVLEERQIPLLVEVFMPPVRDRQANRFVKKTLSIPSWLNAEAERAGVNFSQILQTSLKEHLQVAN
ncbi:MAG: type II toxin-antitoxin system HicB family antitoxin [Defluviitaleaceae bacterium]|nr:type II toxin-antitoxin system HicB family antitoxin [Defluviitaleaceae bacterium]